jgi:hypothetical protein
MISKCKGTKKTQNRGVVSGIIFLSGISAEAGFFSKKGAFASVPPHIPMTIGRITASHSATNKQRGRQTVFNPCEPKPKPQRFSTHFKEHDRE